MKNDREEVKNLLRVSEVNQEKLTDGELNIATDVIFDLANALFDKWVTQKKIYENRTSN